MSPVNRVGPSCNHCGLWPAEKLTGICRGCERLMRAFGHEPPEVVVVQSHVLEREGRLPLIVVEELDARSGVLLEVTLIVPEVEL